MGQGAWPRGLQSLVLLNGGARRGGDVGGLQVSQGKSGTSWSSGDGPRIMAESVGSGVSLPASKSRLPPLPAE